MQRRSARTSHGTYQPITMVSYVEGLRVSIKIQIEFAMTDVSFKSPTYPARAAGTCSNWDLTHPANWDLSRPDLASAACVHTVTVSGHANRTMYEI
jgi:hypothetical protein